MTLALSYADLTLTGAGRLTGLWDRTLAFGTDTLGIRRDQAVGIVMDCRDATKGWIEELQDRGVADLAQTLSGERPYLEGAIANGPRPKTAGRVGKVPSGKAE